MFNFQGKEAGNRFSENDRGLESVLNFPSDSQIPRTSYSPDFSASVAHMDRIIHQRMKTQFPDSPFSEQGDENTVDELGLCQNFEKMNFLEAQNRGFGLNPSDGYNLSQYSDAGFKDFGSSSGDFTKSENDLYNHVTGLGEGYSENRFFGSDFSSRNLNPSHVEENYYKNGLGYNIEKAPQFENSSMYLPFSDDDLIWARNRGMSFPESHNPLIQNPVSGPYSEHDLIWSRNRGMITAESHNPLIQSSDMGANPMYNGSVLYPGRAKNVDLSGSLFNPSRVSSLPCSPHQIFGPRVDNPMYNGSVLYPGRVANVAGNVDSSGSVFNPSRVSSLPCSPRQIFGPRVDNPMCSNDVTSYPHRAVGFETPVCNDQMLYANRSLGGQNQVFSDLGFGHKIHNSAMNFSSMLYPNIDSSVKNMLCNEMIFPNETGDLGGSSYEDGLILEGQSLKKVLEKGESSRLKSSRGRKKKLIHENTNQNSQSLIYNNNPVISETMCGSLFEFRGYIYFIAKDQLGCRFLQRIFEEGHIQDIQIIFNETVNHVCELMIDPFANYLMQRLIEVCSDEQLNQIVFMVTARQGELFEISTNTHGTRVIQKLTESLRTRQQKRLIVSALQMNFLELVRDANGYHVIKSCLHAFNRDDIKYMFAAAGKYCYEMATHQHGCCILKSCIAQSDGRFREKLCTEIASQGFLLAQDAFGNYVVQHVIELKIPTAAAILSSQFRGKYVYLSMQKFSSHVVQTFLNTYENCRATVIEELISVHRFEQLLQDPFANYVIQTAINVTEGSYHDLLVKVVKSHSTLRNSPYCKKLFSGNLLKKK